MYILGANMVTLKNLAQFPVDHLYYPVMSTFVFLLYQFDAIIFFDTVLLNMNKF